MNYSNQYSKSWIYNY